MKIVNPEQTVERIVERMREAAARGSLSSDVVRTVALDRSLEASAGRDGADLDFRLDTEPDIHPIALQPIFQPSPDDSYRVDELLKFNDSGFIENSYLAILKRAPDEEGRDGFLHGLRSGELNKLDVLARLRYSKEGRAKGVEIKGLFLPAATRRLYRVPIIGYLLNLLIAIARLPVMIRSNRQFEAHVFAQREDLVRHVNHIGQTLLNQSRSQSDLLSQLRQHINDNATTHEVVLARIAELNRYLEERVNDEAAERQEEVSSLGQKMVEEWSRLREEQVRLLEVERKRLDSLNEFAQGVDRRAEAIAQSQQSFNQKVNSDLEKVDSTSRYVKAELELQAERLTGILEETRTHLPARLDLEELETFLRQESHALDEFYAFFDEAFRGEREEIKERLKVYLSFLDATRLTTEGSLVLDVGSGRGEWLELLGEQGLRAKGIESNTVLVQQCRQLGFDVEEADLVDYLRSLPDESVGAVTGFHVVEHLSIKNLVEFLNEAMRVLKTEGVLMLETPNPRNVLVGTCNFYFDPTHRNPLPSEVLKFLVASHGFLNIQLLPLNPSDQVPVEGDSDVVHRFNELFYGPMDYGIVAWKNRQPDKKATT